MPDGDLERRLGEVLRDRVGGFTPSGDLPARIGARTRQRAHNRRVAASMAAVAVLLGIAAPLALRGDGDDQETAALPADSAPAETTAAASEGATSRAAEIGGADTTAGADSADDDAGASATIAGSTEAAPGAPAPPAPVSTSTVATAATSSAGPPPLLLAVMPGDSRVALVSTTTGQVVRYVDDGDGTDDVHYGEAGDIVFRAGGCGSSPRRVVAVGPTELLEEPAWQDAALVTSWRTGDVERRAWITSVSCDSTGVGSVLTVQTIAGDPSTSSVTTVALNDVDTGRGIAPPGFLEFSPDGTLLAWADDGGIGLLDVTDPDAAPTFLPQGGQGCGKDATFVPGTTLLLAAEQCEGSPHVFLTYDLSAPEASPVVTGFPVPGLVRMLDIDVDRTGQWMVFTGKTLDGPLTVFVVGPDRTVVTTIPGARSAHWTLAAG